MLSNSDKRTIRHGRYAIGLVMDGIVRRLETNFGPSDNPDRAEAIDAAILHMREELKGWCTSHELGNRERELSSTETAINAQSGD